MSENISISVLSVMDKLSSLSLNLSYFNMSLGDIQKRLNRVDSNIRFLLQYQDPKGIRNLKPQQLSSSKHPPAFNQESLPKDSTESKVQGNIKAPVNQEVPEDAQNLSSLFNGNNSAILNQSNSKQINSSNSYAHIKHLNNN